ncbi:hypothetical protein TGDOM2_214420 [Toxoplasma gondii GAB2-2007-GAL-DOM2]|uniref:Uncharacterized protein n=1 Tax=Toxoplasma gondii GAB2-2007-GAL-DOM2 TaxID=1130820 RepID=A0A086JUX2_TOXGO|nr:hypothetical protein TGDOM2_214420 [Toxoplasma gondii GAB2-2007-GAL-DOM2]
MLADFRGSENSPSIPRAGVFGSGARLRRLAEGGGEKESEEPSASAECVTSALAPFTASDTEGLTDQQQQTDELASSESVDQASANPWGDLEKALEAVGVQMTEVATPLALGSTTVETGQQQQSGEHGGAQMEDQLQPLPTRGIKMALENVQKRISQQHAQLLLALHEEGRHEIMWRKETLYVLLEEQVRLQQVIDEIDAANAQH